MEISRYIDPSRFLDFPGWLRKCPHATPEGSFRSTWAGIGHHPLSDSISGSRPVPPKVRSRYSRRVISEHLGRNRAPHPFGLHFWISPGASESALSLLQKGHFGALGPESGTTPFRTPFLDLARCLRKCLSLRCFVVINNCWLAWSNQKEFENATEFMA